MNTSSAGLELIKQFEGCRLAVDVGYLQPRYLGAPHPRAIENHQQRTLEQAAAGIDQTCHFFPAQDLG